MKKFIQLSALAVSTVLSAPLIAANEVTTKGEPHSITINIVTKNHDTPLCGCGTRGTPASDYFIFMVQPQGLGEELNLDKAVSEGFISNLHPTNDKNGYPSSISFEFDNKEYQKLYSSEHRPVAGIIQMVYPGPSEKTTATCVSPGLVEIVNNDGKYVGESTMTIEVNCKH